MSRALGRYQHRLQGIRNDFCFARMQVARIEEEMTAFNLMVADYDRRRTGGECRWSRVPHLSHARLRGRHARRYCPARNRIGIPLLRFVELAWMRRGSGQDRVVDVDSGRASNPRGTGG